jgi:hypothetical protein
MVKLINYPTLSIAEYEEKNKSEWDDFIEKSKNGTFLHKIDYFHYHKDRFNDCSLIIKNSESVVALLPGNIENGIFYTHSGLTYGGLVTQKETKVEDVLNYFNIINEYLLDKNIKKVIYKAIPHIYSNIPAQEDEYALFRLGAKLISSGISSVICMNERLPYSSLRKRSIKKAHKNKLEIKTDYSYDDFWFILTKNLWQSHKSIPVHNLPEICKLKTYFDDNIKLYCVYMEDECIAGVVMYVTDNVAHVQYISANEDGKKYAALDFLFDNLINEVYIHTNYFDFGISVEDRGYYLNEGLVNQKQGFGGRGVLYQQYEYNVNTILNKKEDLS